MPPRWRVVGKVVVTQRGSYGMCECGYVTEVYAYPENAYTALAVHIVREHGTLDYYVAFEIG